MQPATCYLATLSSSGPVEARKISWLGSTQFSTTLSPANKSKTVWTAFSPIQTFVKIFLATIPVKACN